MEYINEEKINKIKLENSNFYVVIDFDKTITSYESEDSWDVTGRAANNINCDKEIESLYKKYRPIELDYTISIEEKNTQMQKWYNECMGVYYKYKLNKDLLKKALLESRIKFRKGAKEFLEYLEKNNIPTVVLSAGIGNVIEEFLKFTDCYFKNIIIISNFIDFDENNLMKKFDKPMIHTMNKKLEGNLSKEIESKINKLPYGILFGDLVEDTNMIDRNKADNVIRIGFLNESHKNFEVYKKFFDIVLTNEEANFNKARKIIRI